MKHHAPMLAVLALASLAVGCGKDEPATQSQSQAQAAAPQADENRDGRVTREEAVADPKLHASFERHDRNRDGELDRGEFSRLEATRDDAKDDEPLQLRDKRDFPKEFD